MILYPTETIYGLGVNPFDAVAYKSLFELKGRVDRKVSWLVRNIEDIAHFADLSPKARQVAEKFMPGPLTLVLPVKDHVPLNLQSDYGTIGFRISSDPLAQALIEQHYDQHDAPLTCTSANVSGRKTRNTPEEIIKQFKDHRPDFTGFDQVIDGGPRGEIASTVAMVNDDGVTVFRAGAISESDLLLT